MTTLELEQLCTTLPVACDALGAVIIILHKGQRAEVVAATSDEIEDLPGELRTIVDSMHDGDYMPVGNHLGTPNAPKSHR